MKHSFGTHFFRVIPFMAGALIVCEIILTNQLAGSGRTMRTTDKAIDTLRQDNAFLEQQIASASSLATVAVRAGEMGFVEPAKTQYITSITDFPVALNRSR